MNVALHSILAGRKQNLYVIKYEMGEGDKKSNRKIIFKILTISLWGPFTGIIIHTNFQGQIFCAKRPQVSETVKLEP